MVYTHALGACLVRGGGSSPLQPTMKIAIALLYGLYTPDRKWYEGYLDFLSEQFKLNRFQKVLLCGGHTDPKLQNHSEASTVKSYLLNKYPGLTNCELEDRSITTNQNLEFVKSKISPSDDITVYCDQDRKAKVIWIALHHLLNIEKNLIYEQLLKFKSANNLFSDFKYHNLKVVGYDFQFTDKSGTLAQTYTGLLDVISLYHPELEKQNIRQRELDFNLK